MWETVLRHAPPILAYIAGVLSIFNAKPVEGLLWITVGSLWEISDKLDEPTVIIIDKDMMEQIEAEEETL